MPEETFNDLNQYSLLQRLRGGKDLKAVDKYKMKPKEGKENAKSYYASTTSTQHAKNVKEKERYLKALKALVYTKNQKGPDPEQMPSICSCGAHAENLKSVGTAKIHHPCANNCQFYNNEKEYEKALRDILHSMNELF